MERAKQEEWWKSRGGHELYDIFAKIEKENPLAARAFWSAVVGTGRGMNDLQAATIHKKFGGDMNAYNNWRNQAHHGGWEAYEGYFDLANGKWTPGAGYNAQYIKDKTGWDVAGGWQASPAWNWANYQNTLKTGLQSLPGHEEDGAESWNTYLHGAQFGPNGVTYPSVYEQAVGSGLIQPPRPSGPVPKLPARSGPGTTVNNPTPFATGTVAAGPSSPPPAVNVPAPTNTTPSTPVAPAIPTPTNPTGARGTWQYRNQAGQVR
jgi:hypothetical protein